MTISAPNMTLSKGKLKTFTLLLRDILYNWPDEDSKYEYSIAERIEAARQLGRLNTSQALNILFDFLRFQEEQDISEINIAVMRAIGFDADEPLAPYVPGASADDPQSWLSDNQLQKLIADSRLLQAETDALLLGIRG